MPTRDRGAGQFTIELIVSHGTRCLTRSRLCAPGEITPKAPKPGESLRQGGWTAPTLAPRVRGRFLVAKAMRFCPRCDNCRWICEAHSDRPWDGPRACGCGAPGDPCPVCNRVEGDQVPEMPDGFRVDLDDKGWRH